MFIKTTNLFGGVVLRINCHTSLISLVQKAIKPYEIESITNDSHNQTIFEFSGNILVAKRLSEDERGNTEIDFHFVKNACVQDGCTKGNNLLETVLNNFISVHEEYTKEAFD
jgi:hypothetical protein